MQSAGDVIQVTVDGSRIYGPMIMLERDQDGLRGFGPAGIVDLRKDGNALRGIVGTDPTELYLETLCDGGFTMRGLFSGDLSRIDVRADRVDGQLGRCQYNLRRYPTEFGVAYNGRRVCGPTFFQPATISLGPTIASLEPTDRAAIITVLLGR